MHVNVIHDYFARRQIYNNAVNISETLMKSISERNIYEVGLGNVNTLRVCAYIQEVSIN